MSILTDNLMDTEKTRLKSFLSSTGGKQNMRLADDWLIQRGFLRFCGIPTPELVELNGLGVKALYELGAEERAEQLRLNERIQPAATAIQCANGVEVIPPRGKAFFLETMAAAKRWAKRCNMKLMEIS